MKNTLFTALLFIALAIVGTHDMWYDYFFGAPKREKDRMEAQKQQEIQRQIVAIQKQLNADQVWVYRSNADLAVLWDRYNRDRAFHLFRFISTREQMIHGDVLAIQQVQANIAKKAK